MQARLREAASLEKHVLLKKLRDALESLKGRVAGRNKDDVEEAIAMVSNSEVTFSVLILKYYLWQNTLFPSQKIASLRLILLRYCLFNGIL